MKFFQIRFLDSPTSLNKTAVAVVSPTFFPTFLALAKSSQISVLIVEQNFQKLLDLESPPRKGKADRFDWTSYYTLEEMYEWLDVLGSTYPDKVTLFDLGTSYEGRTIRGIKISSQKAVRIFFKDLNLNLKMFLDICLNLKMFEDLNVNLKI